MHEPRYDVSGGQNDPNRSNGYARFWAKEASNPTPDFANDLGYRGYLAALGVSSNVVNFHNFDDYALASGRVLLERAEVNWEANQDSSTKPNGLFPIPTGIATFHLTRMVSAASLSMRSLLGDSSPTRTSLCR